MSAEGGEKQHATRRLCLCPLPTARPLHSLVSQARRGGQEGAACSGRTTLGQTTRRIHLQHLQGAGPLHSRMPPERPKGAARTTRRIHLQYLQRARPFHSRLPDENGARGTADWKRTGYTTERLRDACDSLTPHLISLSLYIYIYIQNVGFACPIRASPSISSLRSVKRCISRCPRENWCPGTC